MEVYSPCQLPPRRRRSRVRNLPPRLRPLPPRRVPHHQCHGVPLQHQHRCNEDKPIQVCQVWAQNAEEEFHRIAWALRHGYAVISFDTEFPGFCYTPPGISSDYRTRTNLQHYAVMKMNVERLKLIQVGLTISDESGNLPDFGAENRVVWEFNLSDFDVDVDEHNQESIQLLRKQGMDFERNKTMGVRPDRLAKFILLSGMIAGLRSSVAWITFQGGVDLAFILKLILRCPLPNDMEHFKAWVSFYFGTSVFDVKYMASQCSYLHGGLDRIAAAVNVRREAGESHCAGSDSLLTMMVFMRIRKLFFSEQDRTRMFAGKLHNFV
uniref:poly(A)-specific ribonuclease n=1 Tax=Kalanchoe fedtschenkoi TaxID=63787 RepID=A0A7N0TP56_KALFE